LPLASHYKHHYLAEKTTTENKEVTSVPVDKTRGGGSPSTMAATSVPMIKKKRRGSASPSTMAATSVPADRKRGGVSPSDIAVMIRVMGKSNDKINSEWTYTASLPCTYINFIRFDP
jgi:hypothetical protein